MNDERLAEARRIPLPRDEHEAWVLDVTPKEWLRKAWPTSKCPYRYSPAGVWVRLAMPRNGRMRAELLLVKLADFVERQRGDLHDEFGLPRDTSPEDVAAVVLAKALMNRDSPFVVYNVEPTGRVWFSHRMRRWASWHPKTPRGCR